ncbi:hypothetical protein BV898_02842 [Hypsibius exemplaris]|uniref:Uncharacterized protein n=1 Tax=Hypsibius exemplaris TaxID=2072580 RepID=A0A1W0X762_HYPEX|nr:hypothetical protein BV898_02842 [Hypsibius exemplaris]
MLTSRRLAATPEEVTVHVNPLLKQTLQRSAAQSRAHFSFEAISADDCAALQTANCRILMEREYSDNCGPTKPIISYYNSDAGEVETKISG